VSFRESFIAGDSRAQRFKRMKNGGASVLRLSSPKAGRNRISALGHKRTFGKVRLMSALPSCSATKLGAETSSAGTILWERVSLRSTSRLHASLTGGCRRRLCGSRLAHLRHTTECGFYLRPGSRCARWQIRHAAMPRAVRHISSLLAPQKNVSASAPLTGQRQ
jgi:hypothetical protein